ncbi:MAG: hypothetical protein JWQ43_3680 [Glaciihabitans sp.]|nr:hypothetical protein [Glaciihabitans sp.]
MPDILFGGYFVALGEHYKCPAEATPLATNIYWHKNRITS